MLTTMVTAGALNALGNSTLFNGQSGTAAAGSNGISTAQTAATFGDKLLKNLTNNLAGSAIDAAINGKPFDEKTLTNALASALVTTGMAQGANAIGDAKYNGDINGFTQKVAHAVLGCAGGAATAGNMSGCGAGAVGAVVGELAAEYYMDSHKDNGKTFAENKASALAFAKVMSATAGVIAGGGGNNAAAVNIANTTGANAAENNFLKHAQALAMQKDFDACKSKPGGCSDEATKTIVSKYLQLSNDNIAEVQSCITRGDAQCVTNATKDAALSSEVAVTGVGGAAQVFENRAYMVRNGTIATGTMSDIQLAQKIAGVRQQVCGGLSAAACDTKITQLKGNEQVAALKLFGAAMAGTPLAKALIEAAPALAAAAKISVETCVASPVLCANQAGIAAGDLLAGDAIGGAAVAAGTAAATGKGLSKLEQELAAIKAANTAPISKPVTYSKIEDLYGQTFPVIELSHIADPKTGKLVQDGVLGEQLALQLLNEKTGLNFKPLQNASNHGCDGCAIAINGNTITVVVADAKSSQNGVSAAANATGDPAKKLRGWLDQKWATNPENQALRNALEQALIDGAQVKGITVKVGIPAPGTTGTATFKVEPWTK
ncbi:MAG: hypothetical protein EBR58_01235 [Betaproteobacteria bacterium]|nr:hypothetical protein [Betaproteobacteria bacterium]